MGNCSFLWSAPSGYFALGEAVHRARLLSRLCDRFKSRVLVSTAINDTLPDLAVKKLSTFKKKDGSAGDSFYNLEVGD
jgi:hypothetical protein